MPLSSRESLIRAALESSRSYPLSAMGRLALDAFLRLPGSERWQPKDMFLGDVSKIFDIGLPFALVGRNNSITSHAREIGGAIGDGVSPPTDIFSEVQAGALLSHLNAAVNFVPRKSTSTADIEASWEREAIVDVEVV